MEINLKDWNNKKLKIKILNQIWNWNNQEYWKDLVTQVLKRFSYTVKKIKIKIKD